MSTILSKRNLIAEFESAFNTRKSGSTPVQNHAMQWLSAKGLPGTRSEEYRFTPVTRILEKVLDLGKAITPIKEVGVVSLQLIPDLTCNIIAFINGKYSKPHSSIIDESLTIRTTDVNETKEDSDPFELLNCAFALEAIAISVAKGKTIQYPVAIVYYFDDTSFVFANPVWSCTLAEDSCMTLLEYEINVGSSSHFHNKRSFISVGENAELEYTLIQNGQKNEVQVSNTKIHLNQASRAACFTFTFDGQLVRNNLALILDGERIDAHLYGLYMVSKTTWVDNHTVVDHRKPNSFSNQLYKGIMDGNSKGVFNGKIYVRPDVQKTNAFQSNRNILLGENATVNTKPQLEIWADDVKCSHGCTTGQIDEEALFYLQSRGIGKEMARGMVLNAFGAETFASMKNLAIKTFIEGVVSSKLNPNN